MAEELIELVEDRMETLEEYDEHDLETVYKEEVSALEGAYYELSRIKKLVELGKLDQLGSS